ncbi:MAG: hypothetical protein LBU89_02265 [Fibromonadaceae bacterium]|jgi:hypothetical protein|nr:hypothetical protein [Fibromonadaceae bacterium]
MNTPQSIVRNKLKEDIIKIVDDIKMGYLFDSHFVIRQLLKWFPNKYLEFSGSIRAGGSKIAITNGQIAIILKSKQIKEFIEKVEGETFYSESINGKPLNNAGWRKIKPRPKTRG